MYKSTVIAQCLLNSSIVKSLQMGEKVVQEVFAEYFDGQNFSKWNTQITDKSGQLIIQGAGRSMRINVKLFISNLGFGSFQDDLGREQTQGDEDLADLKANVSQGSFVGGKINGRT